MAFHVYVIELDPEVQESWKFRRANPQMKSTLPCFYVGQTARKPEVRFRQHIKGGRLSNGLWAIRGMTRAYFGGVTDQPIAAGSGGERLYDYVVKPNDGADLVAALESDDYGSVPSRYQVRGMGL